MFFWTSVVLVVLTFGLEKSVATDCQNATDLDDLPQDKFVAYLTDPCRYDKNVIPEESLVVKTSINLTHLEASASQFTAYLTLQLSYTDINLEYSDLSPKRQIVLGGESLKQQIWTPNILMRDGQDLSIIKVDTSNFLVALAPNGSVSFSFKMVAQFYCWLNLKKFPFDRQSCSMKFSDWSYSAANLKLSWHNTPFRITSNSIHFTEYVIDDSELSSDLETLAEMPEMGKVSVLVINLGFYRDVGYYLLIFFIPSYLLVFTAWVTFWLQADAGPPRATLGVSTIVAFITLHLGVIKEIPKVSYIKASDIWFLAVMCFIFLSLAEFAFVNVIWRRRKQIELKKDNSKYKLKSAFMPRKTREDLKKYESTFVIGQINGGYDNQLDTPNGNYKKVEPGTVEGGDTCAQDEEAQTVLWKQMTPQEVAIFVDRKARIVFPVAFFFFNVFYWIFVYCS